MKKSRLIAIFVASMIFGGPAYGHVTGVEHPAGPFHPILGVDHMLLVLAVLIAIGLVVAARR